MKRPLLLSLLILSIDQIIKFYFQINFYGKEWLLLNNWGFTYTVNPGIWINQDISLYSLIILQIIIVILWVFFYYLIKYYHAFYRKSVIIDLSFGFFTTAAFGNLIDRFLFGYARDYFINPIAISNFADICGEIALIFFFIEIILYPKSRVLLTIGTPKQWYDNSREFIKFVRDGK